MSDVLRRVSIKVKNYKCFGETEQGFEKICPLNVIVGRNNSGKSTLLELVRYATNTDNKALAGPSHKGNAPEVVIRQPLEEKVLRSVFPESQSGGPIPGNHWRHASKWVGASITYRIEPNGAKKLVSLDPPFSPSKGLERHIAELANRSVIPLHGKTYRLLRAERDIHAEQEQIPVSQSSSSPPSALLAESGGGATNIIQAFINNADLPSQLVEVKLLHELNEIYSPDSIFERIMVQRVGSNVWEIFLDEPAKGRIPLSHTGSGFKTILLVLILLHLVPYLEKRSPADYVFAFEELENNLHPALQRRLLSYLREFALNNGCCFFLTTHSNVIIDLFSRDPEAQIVHVTHNGERAEAKCAQTYVDNKGINDDLDIRASDLLQANCVVWVEGPSDRLYFNRWIELWSEGALKEGVHYQCMFYGGRLLAHISAADPDEPLENCVPILRLNVNAIILMDSDQKTQEDVVSPVKKRVAEEVNTMGGIAWITQGREVENYIPAQAIAKCFKPHEPRGPDRFDDMAKYLEDNVQAAAGKKFERDKVGFAAMICPVLDIDSLRGVLDLSERLAEACKKIREWNSLDEVGSPEVES